MFSNYFKWREKNYELFPSPVHKGYITNEINSRKNEKTATHTHTHPEWRLVINVLIAH